MSTHPPAPARPSDARSLLGLAFQASGLLRASAGVHAAALAAPLLLPAAWPWSVGALVANHLVITGAGLLPRCDWLGPNLRRLPPAAAARGWLALTIDDGPDPEVTPRVLDALDTAGHQATFFCIARRVAQHPALAREIQRRGHSVQNHSHQHRHDFSLLGPGRLAVEVQRAQATLADVLGQRPRFFRAPAGLRNPFLQPVLQREGLLLASWTRRGFDTRRRAAAPVLAALQRNLAAGDILLLHDGHGGRTADGQPLALAVLPPLLASFAAIGLRSVTLPQAMADCSPGAGMPADHPPPGGRPDA